MPDDHFRFTNAAMILSPNLGYLDMGLPLLDIIRKSNVGTTLIIPYAIIPRGIDVTSTLFKFLPEIFGKFIIVFSDGNHKQIDSFPLLKKYLAFHKDLSILNKKIRLIEITSSLLANKALRKNDFDMFDLVVFDSTELFKEKLVNLFEKFNKKTEFISYHHAIKTLFDSNMGTNIPISFRHIVENTTILTHSQKEINYWTNLFAGAVNNIIPIGILRHQKTWIEKIKSSDTIQNENHILLITRPTNHLFLNEEDKLAALKDIIKLQRNLKLGKILIRLHPKETNKKLYFKAFSKQYYKKTWEFTSLHPFIVSHNALMCICLSNSNVIHDMNALKVPVIIRKNISDYNQSYHQKTSEPNQKMGMVNFSHNYSDLYNETQMILKNRYDYIHKQHNAYENYFSNPEQFLSKVSEILNGY